MFIYRCIKSIRLEGLHNQRSVIREALVTKMLNCNKTKNYVKNCTCLKILVPLVDVLER